MNTRWGETPAQTDRRSQRDFDFDVTWQRPVKTITNWEELVRALYICIFKLMLVL